MVVSTAQYYYVEVYEGGVIYLRGTVENIENTYNSFYAYLNKYKFTNFCFSTLKKNPISYAHCSTLYFLIIKIHFKEHSVTL